MNETYVKNRVNPVMRDKTKGNRSATSRVTEVNECDQYGVVTELTEETHEDIDMGRECEYYKRNYNQ